MTRCAAAFPLVMLAAGLLPLDAAAQAQTAARRGAPWRDVQGFNVVLLVGENERSSGPAMELPGGARKALADVREFLPYRHYRVLDSQWLSCCSIDTVRNSPMTGRLQGVAATTNVRNGARGTNVEMGLAPRTFVFTLWLMESSEATRMPVKFTLRDDLGVRSTAQGGTDRERERAAALRTEREALQSGSGSAQLAHHTPVLDTSFMMEVGETVVVGTSRLGGDKALIALVTAVRRTSSSR